MTKGFVTNSTANSIATMCAKYMEKNFSPKQIIGLRQKYCLTNLVEGNFNTQELLEQFENQTAYFLELFNYLLVENRIEKFLEHNKSVAEIVKDYNDCILYTRLLKQYHRNIFHTDKDCFYFKQDYEDEESFHRNTGTFAANIIDKKIYVLTKEYLLKLHLRQCKECKSNEETNYFKSLSDMKKIELATILNVINRFPDKFPNLNSLSAKEILELGLNGVSKIIKGK